MRGIGRGSEMMGVVQAILIVDEGRGRRARRGVTHREEDDDGFLLFGTDSLRGLVLGGLGRVDGLAWRWLLGCCGC